MIGAGLIVKRILHVFPHELPEVWEHSGRYKIGVRLIVEQTVG